MIWLVMFIFFVIGPCQSLSSGYFTGGSPVDGLYFENAELITAQLIVFLFLLIATITTALVEACHPGAPKTVTYELSDRYFALVASTSIICAFLFVILMGGLGNALADRYSRDIPESLAAPATAALALQAIAGMLALTCMKAKPLNPLGPWLFSACICLLMFALLGLTLNPFNSARFMLLMTYVPLGMILVSGKIRASAFYLAAMAGLLVLMPVLNFTGRYGMSIGEALSQISVSENAFQIPYVDVFDMLVYEVHYLQGTGLYWGGKTLGALLFFVPRELWTGKETLLARDMGTELVGLKSAGTENLSLFFAGEFYADLALLGVGMGACAVAALLTVFGLRRTAVVNGLNLRSFLAMAAAPVIIRGPIGAVMPFFFLQMLFLAGLTRLVCRRVEHAGRFRLGRSRR
jgi:hypothetical protein